MQDKKNYEEILKEMETLKAANKEVFNCLEALLSKEKEREERDKKASEDYAYFVDTIKSCKLTDERQIDELRKETKAPVSEKEREVMKIQQKAIDLSRKWLPTISNYKKDYKPAFRESVIGDLKTLRRSLTSARYVPSIREKALKEGQQAVFGLEVTANQCYEAGCISDKFKEDLEVHIGEISKMLRAFLEKVIEDRSK